MTETCWCFWLHPVKPLQLLFYWPVRHLWFSADASIHSNLQSVCVFRCASNLLTSCQVNQVEFTAELLFCLCVFLLHIDEEDTVTSGAVFIHVWNTHILILLILDTLQPHTLLSLQICAFCNRTCHCHMSVWFSFVNSVHHFIWTANKPFSATLKPDRQNAHNYCKHNLYVASNTGSVFTQWWDSRFQKLTLT